MSLNRLFKSTDVKLVLRGKKEFMTSASNTCFLKYLKYLMNAETINSALIKLTVSTCKNDSLSSLKLKIFF